MKKITISEAVVQADIRDRNRNHNYEEVFVPLYITTPSWLNMYESDSDDYAFWKNVKLLLEKYGAMRLHQLGLHIDFDYRDYVDGENEWKSRCNFCNQF